MEWGAAAQNNKGGSKRVFLPAGCLITWKY